MDTSRAHCTYRTNICWAITPRRPLFSHIIAIPPARAPARAACHLLVFFLTMASCALVLSDKRAVRFERGTRRVVLGCSAVGPASRSSSKKGEVLSSFCEGFLDGGGFERPRRWEKWVLSTVKFVAYWEAVSLWQSVQWHTGMRMLV